jgi:hypothetical protein
MNKLILFLLAGLLFTATACNQKPGSRTLAGSSETANDEASLDDPALDEADPEAQPSDKAKDKNSSEETVVRKKSSVTKKRGQWRLISKLTGSKNRKTKPFRVNGDEWKIKWKTKPGKGEFIVILHDKNSDFTEIITTTDEAESNFQTMRDGGDYYLQIESARPYEVAIEEYR